MSSVHLIRSILLYFTLLVFGFSCQKPFEQEKISQFQNQNWNRFDILEYHVEMEQRDHPVDFYVVFEHTADYPNNYIDINFTLYLPEGGMRTRDYMFDLKDTSGEWSGRLKDGVFRSELPVIQGMSVVESGAYKIRIENKLTKLNTPGVTAVGYQILKSRKQK